MAWTETTMGWVANNWLHAILDDAFDSFVKEDARGMPLDLKNWTSNPDLPAALQRAITCMRTTIYADGWTHRNG